MSKVAVAVLVVALIAAACGDSDEGPVVPEPPPIAEFDPGELTVRHDCGSSFVLGRPDATAYLSIGIPGAEVDGLPLSMKTIGEVPREEWFGSVTFGRDLFDQFCSDVVIDGLRVESGRWDVVDGTLELTAMGKGAGTSCIMRAVATGLVARTDDGELAELGDFELVNGTWGYFPGMSSANCNTALPIDATDQEISRTVMTWVNQLGLRAADVDVWRARLVRACNRGVWTDEVALALAEEFILEDLPLSTRDTGLGLPSPLEGAQALWLMAVDVCPDRFPVDAIDGGPPEP